MMQYEDFVRPDVTANLRAEGLCIPKSGSGYGPFRDLVPSSRVIFD
jgi:hypothetical protein